MKYSADASAQLEREYGVVQSDLTDSWMTLASVLAPSLTSAKAREYVVHGACRRLMIIQRCIDNIFAIYPLNRDTLLSDEDLRNLDINLHAFLINVHGIPDNLAWAYVLEHDSEINPKLKKGQVGFFKKETKTYLPKEVRDYANSDALSNWHKRYAKEYRDALAHRIPPYIPPSVQTPEHEAKCKELESRMVEAIAEGNIDLAGILLEEQRAIGGVCAYFKHSVEGNTAMQLHPQVIVDAKTVMEIISVVRPHLSPS